MGKLIDFCQPPKTGCWSKIKMDNGDPCWISISKKSILVKKSVHGLFGKKIFEKGPLSEVSQNLGKLDMKFPKVLTPDDLMHFDLQIITNAALNCSSIDELEKVLNKTLK